MKLSHIDSLIIKHLSLYYPGEKFTKRNILDYICIVIGNLIKQNKSFRYLITDDYCDNWINDIHEDSILYYMI
jgi:hypothetical protein